MCRNSAHRVEGYRTADHFIVFLAAEICPWAVQLDRFVECDTGQISGNCADAFGRNTTPIFYGFRGVAVGHITVSHLVEDGAVRDAFVAVGCGQIRLNAFAIPRSQLAGVAVDNLRLTVCIAQEQAKLFGLRVLIDQYRCVRKAAQIFQIDFTGLHQAMNHREDEQSICAGCNADPVVGHSIISRADRVDANHARAAFLDFADTHFNRVTVVVFGDTEQHEQLGVIPIWLTEFPERAAHRVNASSGHVDRTEPAVGGVVWRAKPLGPKRSERLRLISTCKERQLFRRLFTDRCKGLSRDCQRFFP